MDCHLTPRLYIDHDFVLGGRITPSADQSHYLQHVLRLKTGDNLRLFNGRDGEWLCRVATIGKKAVEIELTKQTRIQQPEPDLWLCCAIIKKAHFDYMIEKASELGVAVIQPLLTARTQIRELNLERCHAIAIESAEQSERLNIPTIKPAMTLASFIAAPPMGARIIICAESGEAEPLHDILTTPSGIRAAIVTGPEGGFAPDEFQALRQIKGASFARLGPRILRADTAAIAALSCWQTLCGDWREKNPADRG